MADNDLSRARRIGRALKSTRTRAFLTMGVVLGLGAVSTLAYFTDTANVQGATFTAGTLNLKVGTAGSTVEASTPATAYAFNSFAASNLVAGESVAATFVVENAGNVPFTYTATGSVSGTLAPNMRFSVFTGSSAATNANTGPGGTRVGGCTGGTAQASAVVLSGASVTPTAQTVNPAATQVFCVIATLDSATTTASGGNTASAQFVVTAKQLGAP